MSGEILLVKYMIPILIFATVLFLYAFYKLATTIIKDSENNKKVYEDFLLKVKIVKDFDKMCEIRSAISIEQKKVLSKGYIKDWVNLSRLKGVLIGRIFQLNGYFEELEDVHEDIRK